MTSIVPKDLAEDELVHVMGTFGPGSVSYFFPFFFIQVRHIIHNLGIS